MKIYKKIISLILALSVSAIFFSYSKKSDALTVSKTVTFFAAQDTLVKNTGVVYSSDFNVVIPENAALVKTAHIEISGISYSSSAAQQITADLQGGSGSNPKNYTIDASARSQQFNMNYDVSSLVLSTTNAYTLNLTGNATDGVFSIFSAKLIITYEYNSVQNALLKTTEFFVGQENSKTAANNVITKDFSISIPESGPVLQSAFIEISGIFKGSGPGTVQAGLFNSGAPVGYKNNYEINLGSQNSAPKFIIRYDALADINASNNNYTFHFVSDKAINVWSARIYLTYEYSEGGLYPATGYVVSSTFDTGTGRGAGFNSITWNGNLNGGSVRLQLATSDCLNGKTNPPACDDAGTWTYLGPDMGSGCLNSTYYENNPGVPIEIRCFDNHNNKKYFKYKIILCSDPGCVVRGSNNPQVDDVIVNWAP